MLRSLSSSSCGRSRQGLPTRLGRTVHRSQICSYYVFLTDKERSCICTTCELIAEMEGKLRQHFLQCKWLSGCWRRVASVPWPRHASFSVTTTGNEPACCWRSGLWLHWGQHRGCRTSCPLCCLPAAPMLEMQSPPEVSKTQTQTQQNLVSRHNFTTISYP